MAEQQQQLQQKVNENKGSMSDPTSNVLQLVEAAVRRLDDLRIAEKDRANLRQEFTEKLIEAKFKFKDEKAEIRAYYEEALRVAEQKRVDAIREVDVQARKSDKDDMRQQALVLANQVKTTEDNLQSQIRQNHANLQESIKQAVAPLATSINGLEKAQYENQGKSTVSDPMVGDVMRKVEQLILAQGTSAGKGAGMNALWVLIGGAIFLIIGIASFIMSIVGK